MVLLKSLLENGLRGWLSPHPDSPANSAQRFAQAMENYAKTGQAPAPANPAVVATAATSLFATMTGVVQVGSAAAFAQGTDTALTLFWSTIGSSGGFTPGLSAIVPPKVLVAPIQAALAAGMAGAERDDRAERIAGRLDLLT